MIKSFLTVTIRNIIRQRPFSFINIFGLAVGMACTILILLWIVDELGFERFFPDAENIYLVLREDAGVTMGVSSARLASTSKQDIPEVVNSTNLIPLPESFEVLIQNGTTGFEEHIAVAAPNYLEIFPLKFKEGNPATALSDPNSILLTENMEKKYFGSEKAMGRTLSISAFGMRRDVRVSGILENIPNNSDFRNEIILPFGWIQSLGLKDFYTWNDQDCHTFLQLRPGSDLRSVEAKLRQCELKNYPVANQQALHYSLLPLTKIHLHGGGIKFLSTTGDIRYVRIFAGIALIILLIAGINYMNLSTALSLKRMKEIGVRKTVGATRASLTRQFFGESVLFSCIAACFAVLIARLCLPLFGTLAGKTLTSGLYDPLFICVVLLVTVTTGLTAGCYPAVLLSSFKPIDVLKGSLKFIPHGLSMRKVLLAVQFALSTIMIICTIVVFRQLSFIRSSNMGFDKENIVCLKLTGEANRQFDALKNRLTRNSDIIGIARSEPMNCSSWTRSTGMSWPGKQPGVDIPFWVFHPDFDFAALYKMEMSRGRFFSDQFPTDRTAAYVVNEAAVRAMGLRSPLDENIQVWGKTGRIIGVTKDFHFTSFRTVVEPLIIRIPDSGMYNVMYRVLSIRLKPGTVESSMAFIEKAWKEQLGNVPFNYYFYDESLEAQYRGEQRMGTIFECFSILSIVIACLGLFALISLSAEQRTKEIGIRKVLGATTWHVSVILSREFLGLVLASNLIAWPVTYYFMERWLQGFAYRTGLNVWPFMYAGMLALVIAMVTVGWQAVRAASANPVDSLKYE